MGLGGNVAETVGKDSVSQIRADDFNYHIWHPRGVCRERIRRGTTIAGRATRLHLGDPKY